MVNHEILREFWTAWPSNLSWTLNWYELVLALLFCQHSTKLRLIFLLWVGYCVNPPAALKRESIFRSAPGALSQPMWWIPPRDLDQTGETFFFGGDLQQSPKFGPKNLHRKLSPQKKNRGPALQWISPQITSWAFCPVTLSSWSSEMLSLSFRPGAPNTWPTKTCVNMW